MLGRFELLFGILGAWIVSIIIIVIFKTKLGDHLSKGSIAVEESRRIEIQKPPGTRLSKILITVGFGINSLIIFIVIFLCIFDFWAVIAPYIAVDLPYCVNWLGLIGIWIYTLWGTLTIVYNVNYTPLYKPIKKDYVLATGGPYKWVRHPMYASKSIAPIIFFTATGIWISLFGLISWILLVPQVKAEENMMLKKFGIVYREYSKKTGRLFPKFKLKTKREKEINLSEQI
jgi:protein-S-isoprenylcysteine O-methyltransferase Ste14